MSFVCLRCGRRFELQFLVQNTQVAVEVSSWQTMPASACSRHRIYEVPAYPSPITQQQGLLDDMVPANV